MNFVKLSVRSCVVSVSSRRQNDKTQSNGFGKSRKGVDINNHDDSETQFSICDPGKCPHHPSQSHFFLPKIENTLSAM
jgi:hypothetical protein